MATVEQIRILIADPAGADQIFDDAHYTVITDIESNVYRAAASAARSIAAHFAQQVSVTAGPVKIENQQKALRYQELAEDYDARAREGGGSTDGSDIIGAAGIVITGVDTQEMREVRLDPDRYNSSFYRGLHDNSGTNDDDQEDYYGRY